MFQGGDEVPHVFGGIHRNVWSITGVAKMSLFGDFEDYISNSQVMFNWDIYQSLYNGIVENPSPKNG